MEERAGGGRGGGGSVRHGMSRGAGLAGWLSATR